jgi:ATP/maltotriose-dependent transcriptional regulator MalT
VARIAVLQGRVEQAQAILAEAKAVVPLNPGRYGELRRDAPAIELLTRAAFVLSEALVHIGAGDLPTAERVLADSSEALEREGKNVPRANIAAMLARLVLLQGERDHEAARHIEQCRQLALEDQLDAQIKWRSVQALLLAREGRAEEAERLAEQATSLANRSEQPTTRAEALADRAEVLKLVGKPELAARAALEAAELYETKGCAPLAAEARKLVSVIRTTG